MCFHWYIEQSLQQSAGFIKPGSPTLPRSLPDNKKQCLLFSVVLTTPTQSRATIVLSPFHRISQHRVGLIDLLELPTCYSSVTLWHMVWMVLQSQASECCLQGCTVLDAHQGGLSAENVTKVTGMQTPTGGTAHGLDSTGRLTGRSQYPVDVTPAQKAVE